MKKLAVTIVASLFAISTMAQDYLTFKGIPIKGSIKAFCQKLREKGLTQIHLDNNTAFFSGDFTGRDANIGVVSDDDGQNVFCVMVFFESSGEWSELTSTYSYYKDIYTRKYGKPDTCVEQHPAIKYYNSPTNWQLMNELYQGTVTWGTLWEVDGGEIEISIERDDVRNRGMVIISYRDEQNEEIKTQKHLDEI